MLKLWSRLSFTFVRTYTSEFCFFCTAGGIQFFMFAANRCLVYPMPFKVATCGLAVIITTFATAIGCVYFLQDITNELPCVILCTSVLMAPFGYIGTAFGFYDGCVLFVSFCILIGVIMFLLLPLRIASWLASMREGDMINCNFQEWVVLAPIGDGHGVLAVVSGAEIVSECYIPARIVPCMRLKMRRRMGVADTVLLISTAPVFFAHPNVDPRLGLAFRVQRPVRVIQRAWRRVNADPKYILCRKRLVREAMELDDDMMKQMITNK
jgi:hypothetical protein